MRSRLIFSGVLLLLAGLFAYHFYAANDAERKLDEAIQQMAAEENVGLNISYSSIQVTPFDGDILISDLNIIGDNHIQRAGTARLDLTYSDFLNFTVRGTEDGLKRVESGVLGLTRVSYTDRSSLTELKVDSIRINYTGNLWNLIVLGVTGRQALIRHDITGGGTGFAISQPDPGIGVVTADTIALEAHFGKPETAGDTLESRLSLSSITWSPPSSVQQKYGFFIRGFGYQAESIPFRRASMRYSFDRDRGRFTIGEMAVVSELFTTTLSGDLLVNYDEVGRSLFDSLAVRVDEMSPRFRNFLDQLNKLMGMRIPGSGEELHLRVNGPLSEPRIAFQP